VIEKNVMTDFSGKVSEPVIDPTTYVHPLAAVIGNVILGKSIMVSPMASIRGDEGQPLYVGDKSNVQDGVVIHALETELDGKPVEKNLYAVDGKKYAVYVGSRVSLAHQVQIHGPAVVMDDTFVGMKSLVSGHQWESSVSLSGCDSDGSDSSRWSLRSSRFRHHNSDQADRLPR